MITKKAYESLVDKFNSNYNIIGDFDICIRLSINWKFLYLENVLAYCRWHGKNLQITEANLHLSELKKWYAENKLNDNLTKLDGFRFFQNKLARMESIILVKNGFNKDAYKSLKHIKSLLDKVKILILILLPNKFIKLIFNQNSNL